jgi:hypothetical protein
MKTEVYRWRVSTDVKTGLEREARRRKISLSAVLDLAAKEWLQKIAPGNDDEEEQRRLHQAALKCLGTLAGGDPLRSENASQAARQRLRQHHGR